MEVSAESVEVLDHINIASYVLFLPTLALSYGLLFRMLSSKDREKFFGLIVICVLMIIS